MSVARVLQVDAALHAHIEELRRLSGIKAPKEASWGLLPPQAPQHKGKLTVLLDLDGTLITSFPPKRAPRVPPSMRTHIVGIGSKVSMVRQSMVGSLPASEQKMVWVESKVSRAQNGRSLSVSKWRIEQAKGVKTNWEGQPAASPPRKNMALPADVLHPSCRGFALVFLV
eukprot:1065396-Pelagomonas_calceolata.AAC.3